MRPLTPALRSSDTDLVPDPFAQHIGVRRGSDRPDAVEQLYRWIVDEREATFLTPYADAIHARAEALGLECRLTATIGELLIFEVCEHARGRQALIVFEPAGVNGKAPTLFRRTAS